MTIDIAVVLFCVGLFVGAIKWIANSFVVKMDEIKKDLNTRMEESKNATEKMSQEVKALTQELYHQFVQKQDHKDDLYELKQRLDRLEDKMGI